MNTSSSHSAFLFGQWNDTSRSIDHVDVQFKKPEHFYNLDQQAQTLQRNLQSFIQGGPFLHTLLWGEMGCGKSSLVKSVLCQFKGKLSALQIRIDQLHDLQHIIDQHFKTDHFYVLYLDDLSLSRHAEDFYFLKTFLDGGFFQVANNIMMIATSNRRHLTAEYQSDNDQVSVKDNVLHYGDEKNDALALSDRFGISLSFYSLTRAHYVELVYDTLCRHINKKLVFEQVKEKALAYALQKGGHNGRTAMQCVAYIQIMFLPELQEV